jgi:hypothetical protein
MGNCVLLLNLPYNARPALAGQYQKPSLRAQRSNPWIAASAPPPRNDEDDNVENSQGLLDRSLYRVINKIIFQT